MNFENRVYGLTCNHVFQDFELAQLFITPEKIGTKGCKPGKITGIAYPSFPKDAAVGSDITDICERLERCHTEQCHGRLDFPLEDLQQLVSPAFAAGGQNIGLRFSQLDGCR